MKAYTSDEFFMNRCIELAKMGKGNVAPNPMVGAVIVHNNKIIGEGYHKIYGGPHAEVNAINQVIDKTLLEDSIIYVSLEPCAHTGKTPPCADLIVKHNIRKVVIGMVDPFARVNGLGIKKLKSNGAEVIIGVLNKECINLNREFITFHTQKRPHIILKWAQTKDGFIDRIRNPEDKQEPNWITNEACRALVHKWRSEISSILVGTNTAHTDNPNLDVRTWSGSSPIRIVFDRTLRLPNTLNLFNKKQTTLVINEIKNEQSQKLEYIKIPFNQNFISSFNNLLYNRKISSVLIEGGLATLKLFIENNYWDEARVFIGNKLFDEGVPAPKIYSVNSMEFKLDDSTLIIHQNN